MSLCGHTYNQSHQRCARHHYTRSISNSTGQTVTSPPQGGQQSSGTQAWSSDKAHMLSCTNAARLSSNKLDVLVIKDRKRLAP